MVKSLNSDVERCGAGDEGGVVLLVVPLGVSGSVVMLDGMDVDYFFV
jgi:hypothetical protein